jgi:leucyl/phenylalanyl-tRNA--protein transferase
MYFLTKELWFPDPRETTKEGVLAIGGDLSPERLMLAYRNGIFPWFNEEEPIVWWSPIERMVLFPENLKISKSMKSVLNKDKFQYTVNHNFEEVILNCAKIKRKGEQGTWITNDMIQAYITLHQLGYAHSVEAWQEGKLVGGLYGIYLQEKGIFCGESMFTKVSNASKFAFIKMNTHFKTRGLKLVDCQMYTSHLESLGAKLICREEFLKHLN